MRKALNHNLSTLFSTSPGFLQNSTEGDNYSQHKREADTVIFTHSSAHLAK